MKVNEKRGVKMQRLFTVHDVSNFIIIYCKQGKISVNNMRLNGLLSYLYYDSKARFGYPLFDEEPVRMKHFYIIESIYQQFQYMGAEEILFIPSDFDFMTLLDSDFKGLPKRLSPELLESVEAVKGVVGDYIKGRVEVLKDVSVFDFLETLDDKQIAKEMEGR